MQEVTVTTDHELFANRMCATQGLTSSTLCVIPEGDRTAGFCIFVPPEV